MPGRKRHVLVDTLGLLLNVDVCPAGVQDHDAAALGAAEFSARRALVGKDGTQGSRRAALMACTGLWRLEIVRRSDLHRFVVLPKRWIVKWTLAWISCSRHLCGDYERHTCKTAAFVRFAMIRIMFRRCAISPSK